jgi:hypothetical protein
MSDLALGILYPDGQILLCGDRPDEGELVSFATIRTQRPGTRLTTCPPGRGVGACIADVLRANGQGQYAGEAAALRISPVTLVIPGSAPVPAILFADSNRVKFRVGSSARVTTIDSLFSNATLVAPRDLPGYLWG